MLPPNWHCDPVYNVLGKSTNSPHVLSSGPALTNPEGMMGWDPVYSKQNLFKMFPSSCRNKVMTDLRLFWKQWDSELSLTSAIKMFRERLWWMTTNRHSFQNWMRPKQWQQDQGLRPSSSIKGLQLLAAVSGISCIINTNKNTLFPFRDFNSSCKNWHRLSRKT